MIGMLCISAIILFNYQISYKPLRIAENMGKSQYVARRCNIRPSYIPR
jgi:hypothetical protein